MTACEGVKAPAALGLATAPRNTQSGLELTPFPDASPSLLSLAEKPPGVGGRRIPCREQGAAGTGWTPAHSLGKAGQRLQQNGKGGWTESTSSERRLVEGKELGTGDWKEWGQRRYRHWRGGGVVWGWVQQMDLRPETWGGTCLGQQQQEQRPGWEVTSQDSEERRGESTSTMQRKLLLALPECSWASCSLLGTEPSLGVAALL